MAEQEGCYDPKVDVSFAPTEAFVRKWGVKEGAKQAKRYNQPSWQKQVQEEELFIPIQLDDESDENPLLTETERDVNSALIFGLIGGAVLAFSVVWIAKKFGSWMGAEVTN